MPIHPISLGRLLAATDSASFAPFVRSPLVQRVADLWSRQGAPEDEIRGLVGHEAFPAMTAFSRFRDNLRGSAPLREAILRALDPPDILRDEDLLSGAVLLYFSRSGETRGAMVILRDLETGEDSQLSAPVMVGAVMALARWHVASMEDQANIILSRGMVISEMTGNVWHSFPGPRAVAYLRTLEGYPHHQRIDGSQAIHLSRLTLEDLSDLKGFLLDLEKGEVARLGEEEIPMIEEALAIAGAGHLEEALGAVRIRTTLTEQAFVLARVIAAMNWEKADSVRSN